MSKQQLLRETPESQGISSAAILKFVQGWEEKGIELHSFMLLRHGKVLAEGWWSPYAAQHPHLLWSLSKSFTSTGIGLAVTEGRLSVDDRVLSFFPEDVPADVSPNLAEMRVRHLLTMATGHAVDSMSVLAVTPDPNWVKVFLAVPVEYTPGTHFLYDTGASYMLSAIVQKVTGMKLFDYLGPRLFEPLGIQDATWEVSPQGINMGGFGLSVKTEDIARFGQMYLQKGVWNGQCILPAAWVETATSALVDNGAKERANEPLDWRQGYGYQFWRSQHHAYRGDGACGQYCLVMPDQDAVLAITAGVDIMQGMLDHIWETLFPAMQPGPLAENKAAHHALSEKLAYLALPFPTGMDTSPVVARVSGKRYAVAPSQIWVTGISFDFSDDGCRLALEDLFGTESILCGSRGWQYGSLKLFNPTLKNTAAHATWLADDTLVITLRFHETPVGVTWTVHFSGERITIEHHENVTFGAFVIPPLEGKMITK